MDQQTSAATNAAEIDAFLGVQSTTRRAKLLKWISVALGAALLLYLLWTLFFSAAAPTAYATVAATRGDLEVTVSATGNLAPTTQVNVGVEQSGTVEGVYVNNNDRVRKGQVLARLDLSKLRDALTQSQAALAQATATVAQNRATAQQSKATLDRYLEVSRLSGGKVPSATELDVAKGDYARALANVQAAQAGVGEARAQVSTNTTNVSKGVIYSPVDGVVLSRQVEPGQTVAASFSTPTLFTIAEDLSQMKLEVKVDEADVGDVHADEQARFTVDAYPGRTFPASVTRVDVGANASPQINSAGTTVSSSTTSVIAYTAALQVQNPDLLLKPGMTATADIVTARKQGVLLVPNAALRFHPARAGKGGGAGSGGGITSALVPSPRMGRRGGAGGGGGGAGKTASIGRGSRQAVYVVGADGKPKRVRVTVGQSDGQMTEITGGDLEAGQRVITGQLAAAGSDG